MTTLLARARSCHHLTLLLVMTLAWPGSFAPIVWDIAGTGEVTSTNVHRPGGSGSHRPDRHLDVDQGDWSILVDNTEDSDDRDDFRCPQLAIPHRPKDLPSLVPSGLVSRQLDPTDPGISFRLAPHLRC